MKGILAILKALYSTIAGIGALTVGLFVLFMIAVLVNISGREAPIFAVPQGSVLVLEPVGVVVEQTRLRDPLTYAFDEFDNDPPETAIKDVIDTLLYAASDDRIAAVALSTDQFWGAGPSHLHDMADALRAFKDVSGKKVYAISSSYSQAAYMLAAEADKIFLNPAGSLLLTGYGAYPNYYKGLLDKVDAEVNIFRVGTYKSAVEPFEREGMSDAAKEANLDYLNTIWDAYKARIVRARGVDADALDTLLQQPNMRMRSVGGDFAELALQEGLVDALTDRKTWRRELMAEYGATNDNVSFRQVHWRPYLNAMRKPERGNKKIAVITAQGEIVMGSGPITVTAGETVVNYIRNARHDSSVAAIVLRVDSPGGSAFASELIRQELAAAQEAGKPVVASFGPVAASGGYWISATADEIYASPTTITGSIGIFAVIPTFERSLAHVGVTSDGVGTGPLAGGVTITRDLTDPVKEVLQLSIESGYDDFISLVSKGRSLPRETVESVAQGRVWTGDKALELGLVDSLGDLTSAISAAARLAEIDGPYQTVFYRDRHDQLDQALINFFDSRMGTMVMGARTTQMARPPGAVMDTLMRLKADAERLARLNDPAGAYVLCTECSVR